MDTIHIFIVHIYIFNPYNMDPLDLKDLWKGAFIINLNLFEECKSQSLRFEENWQWVNSHRSITNNKFS